MDKWKPPHLLKIFNKCQRNEDHQDLPIFMTHLTSGSREGACPNPHWTLKYHRNRPDPGTYILVYTSLPDPTSYSLEFRFMYKIAGYISWCILLQHFIYWFNDNLSIPPPPQRFFAPSTIMWTFRICILMLSWGCNLGVYSMTEQFTKWKKNKVGREIKVYHYFARVLNFSIPLFCIETQEYKIGNAELFSTSICFIQEVY